LWDHQSPKIFKSSWRNQVGVRRHISEILVGFVLLVITTAVYWQVKGFDFIYYDDGGYVFENFHVLNGWTADGFKWAFTTQHSRHWHPLTWLSHMTDCRLFGLNPGLHHLVSLFFHLANTVLLFIVFNRMTGALLKSALVAALFALHPLHVETVVWVSDRKDLLCAFFWLLTMGAYVLYAKRPGIGRYVVVFLFFVLAILSKSMAITLPFVLLLMDYWPLGRFKRSRTDAESDSETDQSPRPHFQIMKIGRLLAEKMGFFGLGGVALFVAVLSMYWSKSADLWMVSTDSELIARAPVTCVIYIGKMIWPFGLIVPYPDLGKVQIWETTGALMLLTLISVVAIRWARKRPYFLFGWLWYLITLMPVLGLVYGAPQKIADRYTYIPMVGLFVMIIWGIENMMQRLPNRRTVLAASAGILLSALAAGTWVQASHWKNSITMLNHALDLDPYNYPAMCSLGSFLAKQGKFREATTYYYQTLEIKPDYAKAHTNLGAALSQLGKPRDAQRHYEEALRIDSSDWKAHYNLGNLLAGKGDLEKAIIAYKETIKIKPDHAWTHNNLGIVLIRQGKHENAIVCFSAAVRINPNFPEAHYNLGRALAEQGDRENAMGHYAAAVRIKPGYTKARRDLENLKQLKKESGDVGVPVN
jgi:protein O-mannosyl-transferase